MAFYVDENNNPPDKFSKEDASILSVKSDDT